MVENVRVRLSKADREKEMVRLGELASVVPRGRNVAVLVGEKDVSVTFDTFWVLDNCNGSGEEELVFSFVKRWIFLAN